MTEHDQTSSKIDHLSLATTPVVAAARDRPVWQGSGFFYLRQRQDKSQTLFLITSLHVLTGKAPGESQASAADQQASQADQIVFQFHESAENPGAVRPVHVPLYTRHGRPTWIESSTVASADVAAIPIAPNVCEDLTVYCVDRSWGEVGNTNPTIASVVNVIGFPLGLHDKENALPLWQTGTLASEPTVNFGGEPCVAVEVPSYPGVAGAPVTCHVSYQPPSAVAGRAQAVSVRRVIGVYSPPTMGLGGRYPEAFCGHGNPVAVARDAGSVGRVWRMSVVADLIEHADVERWRDEVLTDLP